MGATQIALLVFLNVCVWYAHAADSLVVSLPVGKVQGRARATVNKVPFYSFQGIPYAEPPVKALRFQPPVAKKAWTDVLDATKEQNGCYQLNYPKEPTSEDCLYINVFTPKLPSNKSEGLPVMFYIYGGDFIDGSSVEINYGPHHLMEKEVILVTFNYRAGAFGFLSTNDTVVPGNAGLKDQVLALTWTNKYISYFGGDPKKITIFGHSGGAASVGLHLISPLTKGLFRAAISQSGSVLSPFAYQRDQKTISFKMAEYVDPKEGAAIKTSKELLEFLQKQPAETIQSAARSVTKYLDSILYTGYVPLEMGSSFAPVIEKPHEGAFLLGPQHELLINGEYHHVPWLAGFTASESLFYLDDEPWAKQMAKNLDTNNHLLVPDGMNLPRLSKIMTSIGQMITDFYAYKTNFSSDLRRLVQYASDQSFCRGILKQAQIQSEQSDVYIYYWRYLGVLGGKTNKSVEGFSDDTRHGEELNYLFARNYPGLNTTDLSKFSKNDRLVAERFLTLITDFVKYLNPTPQPAAVTEYITWPKYNDTAHYVDIGSDLVVRLYPRWSQFTFWENLFVFGKRPFDTY